MSRTTFNQDAALFFYRLIRVTSRHTSDVLRLQCVANFCRSFTTPFPFSILVHITSVRCKPKVLVLISGGCDSVALLLALHEAVTSSALNIHLEAVHFNHALRGEGSDDDEAFVVDLAAELKIPLHIRRWERRDEGGTGGAGAGMQARARDWRRAEAKSILGGITGVDRIGFIATAHHRDDQVETVLMKALRGAHITKMQVRTFPTKRVLFLSLFIMRSPRYCNPHLLGTALRKCRPVSS